LLKESEEEEEKSSKKEEVEMHAINNDGKQMTDEEV
jgi:hypothetical protein